MLTFLPIYEWKVEKYELFVWKSSKMWQVDHFLRRTSQLREFTSTWLELSERISEAVMEDDLIWDITEIRYLCRIFIIYYSSDIYTSFITITYYTDKMYYRDYKSSIWIQWTSDDDNIYKLTFICSDSASVPQPLSLAGLVVAGQLVVLQVEAPVHVVDAVRDLVGVRHHPQVEGLRRK